VFSETDSSPAISGRDRFVGRYRSTRSSPELSSASRRYRAGADAATAEVKSGSTPSCANMADVPIWQLNS
jgi:hypothetical protein